MHICWKHSGVNASSTHCRDNYMTCSRKEGQKDICTSTYTLNDSEGSEDHHTSAVIAIHTYSRTLLSIQSRSWDTVRLLINPLTSDWVGIALVQPYLDLLDPHWHVLDRSHAHNIPLKLGTKQVQRAYHLYITALSKVLHALYSQLESVAI